MIFITICTEGRQHLFGDVRDGVVDLSPSGLMITGIWGRVPDRFPDVLLDTCIVMPDHLHGIILMGARPDIAPTGATTGDIVRWFKSSTHAAYRKGVLGQGWPSYDRHLWQRSYYDHIVCNDADLDRIRAYIEANPARWSMKQDQPLS